MTFLLANISGWMIASIILFIVIAALLILVILIQKGKGGGVGAMFGGAGASSLLGTKTGDFMTYVTIVLVLLFLGLAVLMDKFIQPKATGELLSPPAPIQPTPLPSEEQMPVGVDTEAIPEAVEEAAETAEDAAKEAQDAGIEMIEEEPAPPIEENAEPMEEAVQ